MYNVEPTSYRSLLSQRQQAFDAGVAAGKFEPFLYPWDTLPVAMLILAVLFLPGLRPKYSRWASYGAFLLIMISCVSIIRHCRSTGLGGGYGIGLVGAYGTVWSAVLLVFNDPKTAFKRVERRDGNKRVETRDGNKKATNKLSSMNGTGRSTSPKPAKSSLRNRRVHGIVEGAHEAGTEAGNTPFDSHHVLIWQSYPDNLPQRLNWVLSLCTNFRGPGWNWHIQTLPAADYPSPTLLPTPPSSARLLRRIAIRDLLIWYLITDIVKTLSMNDPYFWGTGPITSPAPMVSYLPSIVTNHPPLIRLYRLVLCLGAIFSTLSMIFALSPFFFAVVLPILKLDRYTRAPLSEPFLYPPYWGDFATSVLDRGLAGWWGRWWHQIFRMAVSEPSRFLVERLGWHPRSPKARLLQLTTAFAISGVIHAAGSHTSFNPHSRPLSGPLLFFFSQGLAILAEQFLFKTMAVSKIAARSWPTFLRRAGTASYLLAWFYVTGPWFVDDFVKSEFMLWEPVPISPVRGFGFGAQGEGWWCWHGRWAIWWSGIEGTPWWRKGIAI